MPKPQSAQSHASNDYVFIAVAFILLINLIFAVYYTIREWPNHPHTHPWWIVMSIALFIMAFKTRSYAQVEQDRIIRLEERLRYAAILPPAELAAARALTLPQIIALRFASDSELPTLIRRTLAESLPPKAIKAAITDWQPDYHRV